MLLLVSVVVDVVFVIAVIATVYSYRFIKDKCFMLMLKVAMTAMDGGDGG